MRTRAALSILVALWLIALATSTARADEGWTITSFHSDIQIAADSALTITETINVDFGSLEKHGIFRTIPLRYRYDDAHDRYYELSVGSVTAGLTHELNNPVTAVMRATDRLREMLAEMREKVALMVRSQLPADQLEAIADLAGRALERRRDAPTL